MWVSGDGVVVYDLLNTTVRNADGRCLSCKEIC